LRGFLEGFKEASAVFDGKDGADYEFGKFDDFCRAMSEACLALSRFDGFF